MNHSLSDIQKIAQDLIDNCIIDENEKDTGSIQDDFKSDYYLFKKFYNQYRKGINKEGNLEYMKMFFNVYPVSCQLEEITKAVEILQITKVKHILKSLDITKDEDLKVYMKIIELRNNLMNKHNKTII